VQRNRRFGSAEWDRQDLTEQRRRLRTVPIEDRLQEVIAWSAALLAGDVGPADAPPLDTLPEPVGLGPRRQ
jgi:hypothetical protein